MFSQSEWQTATRLLNVASLFPPPFYLFGFSREGLCDRYCRSTAFTANSSAKERKKSKAEKINKYKSLFLFFFSNFTCEASFLFFFYYFCLLFIAAWAALFPSHTLFIIILRNEGEITDSYHLNLKEGCFNSIGKKEERGKKKIK